MPSQSKPKRGKTSYKQVKKREDKSMGKLGIQSIIKAKTDLVRKRRKSNKYFIQTKNKKRKLKQKRKKKMYTTYDLNPRQE